MREYNRSWAPAMMDSRGTTWQDCWTASALVRATSAGTLVDSVCCSAPPLNGPTTLRRTAALTMSRMVINRNMTRVWETLRPSRPQTAPWQVAKWPCDSAADRSAPPGGIAAITVAFSALIAMATSGNAAAAARRRLVPCVVDARRVTGQVMFAAS